MLDGVLADHPDGVVIEVWVVAGAATSEVAGIHGDAVRVRVAAAAERGKANLAVARLLEEATGGTVELLSGARARRKRYLVRGVSRKGLAELLRHRFP